MEMLFIVLHEDVVCYEIENGISEKYVKM